MTQTRTYADKEARRWWVVRQVLDGWTQTAVADFLEVHPVTVNEWVRVFETHGDDGLARSPCLSGCLKTNKR